MHQMICHRLAIDEHIIEEDDDGLLQDGLEQLIHGCLECRWSVTQTKRHHSKLVMPLMRSECGFVDVSLLHQNLMIALHQIQLGEPSSSIQFV